MSAEPDTDARRAGRFRAWMVVPLIGAFAVLTTFFFGLGREGADDLPSMLIDKPAPTFALESLRPGMPGFSNADLAKPGVKLVNVWASWCGPCRVEHPVLERLAADGITIYGINYKDKPADAIGYLDRNGDPYALIGADVTGRVGIDWGVYGVPETFVVDGDGRIVYRHIGPIQGDDVRRRIMPALERAAAR